MSEASFGKQNLRELAFETIEHEFGYLRSSLGTPEIKVLRKRKLQNETVRCIPNESKSDFIVKSNFNTG